MSFAFSSRGRAIVLFVSAAAYSAWFSGLGERGDASDLPSEAPTEMRVVPHRAPPSVATTIRRDPFARNTRPAGADVANANEENVTGGAMRGTSEYDGRSRTHDAPAIASARVDDGPDVPNIASDAGPGATGAIGPSETLVLRATIVGPSPVAYVGHGTSMDIVRVGDTLGGRRVARIDLHGIAFADGSRLDLPDAYANAAPVPVAAHAVAPSEHPLTLEALRRFLVTPSPARSDARITRPQAADVATPAPTDAALPLVDRNGLPAGATPTPDANGPTAFPYPYPYPPPPPR